MLLGTKDIAALLGARALLVAPCIATSNKGIATINRPMPETCPFSATGLP